MSSRLIKELPVEEVAAALVERAAREPAAYDDRDLAKLTKSTDDDNSFVRKFLNLRAESCKSQEQLCSQTVEAMDEVLRWRQATRVGDRRLVNFPAELNESGIVTIGQDVSGRTVVYIRSKLGKYIAEWAQTGRNHIAALFEHFEFELKERPGLVIDLSGAGVSNLDLDVTVHVIKLLSKYYPSTLSFLWLSDLSWFARPLLKVAFSFLSEHNRRMVRMVTRKEVLEELGPNFVPTFMGGTARTAPLPVAGQAPSLVEYAATQDIDKVALAKFQKHLEHCKDVLLGEASLLKAID